MVVVALVIVLAACQGQGSYEQKVYRRVSPTNVSRRITAMGNEGWELVSQTRIEPGDRSPSRYGGTTYQAPSYGLPQPPSCNETACYDLVFRRRQ